VLDMGAFRRPPFLNVAESQQNREMARDAPMKITLRERHHFVATLLPRSNSTMEQLRGTFLAHSVGSVHQYIA